MSSGTIIAVAGSVLVLGGFLIAFVVGPAAVRKAEAAGRPTVSIGLWRALGLFEVLFGLGLIVLGPDMISLSE